MNEKNRIIILRSQDIVSDSRVLRYEKLYRKEHIPYQIVGWNRQTEPIDKEHTKFFNLVSKFQQREKAIKNRVKWNYFLLKTLWKHRNEYDTIHACDYDTVYPSLFMKLFGKRVIFDIFDWFSDECFTGKVHIDTVINLTEKFAVKLADLVILCEEERLKQIGVTPSHYIVMSNVPEIDDDKLAAMHSTRNRVLPADDTSINVVYVGGLVEHRGLAELIEVASKVPQINFHIAGFGNPALEERIRQYASDYDNIHFWGKVDYELALQLMSEATVLYAMYYKTNRNHIWAAPNKFYESILLEKVIITTEGTLVGDKVKRLQNGFVIEEGSEALLKLFEGDFISQLCEKEQRLPALKKLVLDKLEEQRASYLKWVGKE